MKTTHIQFSRIIDDASAWVPIENAWAHFTSHCATERVTRARIEDREGALYESFAKAWQVWDFTNQVWQMSRVGLGANGDYGPTNPDARIHGPAVSRLTAGGWITGIE